MRCRVLVILLMATAVGTGASAQGLAPVFPRPLLMGGYAANAPQVLLGAAVVGLPPGLGGWGLYGDVKTSLGSPANDSDFMAGVDRAEAQAQWNDVVQKDHSHWRALDVAVVRAFRDDLILYLGGGGVHEDSYVQLFDATQERGTLGFYWVHDEAASGWRANLLGGMFFRIARHLAVQFGAETTPPGFTVGMLLVY